MCCMYVYAQKTPPSLNRRKKERKKERGIDLLLTEAKDVSECTENPIKAEKREND